MEILVSNQSLTKEPVCMFNYHMSIDSLKKILVVEDEDYLRELMVDTLKEQGYQVLEAATAELGLTHSLKSHPNLILLDVILPQMDALAMLKKIRKDAWGESVPVIILSNLNDQERITEAMKLGVYDYFVKMNLQLKDLVKEVKEVLESQ